MNSCSNGYVLSRIKEDLFGNFDDVTCTYLTSLTSVTKLKWRLMNLLTRPFPSASPPIENRPSISTPYRWAEWCFRFHVCAPLRDFVPLAEISPLKFWDISRICSRRPSRSSAPIVGLCPHSPFPSSVLQYFRQSRIYWVGFVSRHVDSTIQRGSFRHTESCELSRPYKNASLSTGCSLAYYNQTVNSTANWIRSPTIMLCHVLN